MEANPQLKHYTIILKFYPSNTNYSFNVSSAWRLSKLRKFIQVSFDHILRSAKFSLLHRGQRLNDYSVLLRDLFHYEEINALHVMIHEEEGDKRLKTHKEIFKSSEFALIEAKVYSDYFQLANQSKEKNDFGFFPFAHPCLTQRMEVIHSQNLLEQLKGIEIGRIENFPLHGYVQLFSLVRLLGGLFVLKDFVNDWNLPLVLAGFIGYYWMEVANLVREHYKKKIYELALTNEELNEEKDEGNGEFHAFNGNIAPNGNAIHPSPIETIKKHKKTERIIEELLDEQAKEARSISSQNSIIDTSKAKTEQDAKEEDKKPESSSKDEANSNLASINSPPQENKRALVPIMIEIVFTFFLTLIPFWSDEYELKNPMPPAEAEQPEANPTQEPNPQQEGNMDPSGTRDAKDEAKLISSNTSEKVNLPSSINDDQHIPHPLLKHNDNKTESEYVFSENVAIDNISNNESAFEFQRNKADNEEEDEDESKRQKQ